MRPSSKFVRPWLNVSKKSSRAYNSKTDAEALIFETQVKQDVAQSETKREKKPQQHGPGIKEQLRELIVMRKASNREVFHWIEVSIELS